MHQILLILDVDGVVRESIEALADPRVIQGVKSLLEHPRVRVVFLSGSAVVNDPTLEPWRRGNTPLSVVFGGVFEEELQSGRVSIYGMLGDQRLQAGGIHEVLDVYPLETTFELARLLTHAFLQEVFLEGTPKEREIATQLEKELSQLTLSNPHQPPDATPEEFSRLASQIRSSFDPEWRLVSNGATAETQVFSSRYRPERALSFVKERVPIPVNLATGHAKKGDLPFHFLLISRTHKGHATQRLVRDHQEAYVITVGDTQIDFPMHKEAHLSFHVGLASVWQAQALPHCHLVRDRSGCDAQHVEGTLSVLNFLDSQISAGRL